MDLIGSIRYIGSRLDEKKSGAERPAKKRDGAQKKKAPPDSRLGSKIDTSA